MSSIYRKGRDNYFYYQTYIYNPKTGKKDKRIFHSLGTKKKEEAELLKKEYDLKYEKKRNQLNDKKPYSQIKKLIYFSIISVIIVYNFIYKYNKTNKSHLTQNYENIYKSESINSDSVKSGVGLQDSITKINNSVIVADNDSSDSYNINQNIDYEIIRTLKLSGTFNQGKIFLVVDKKASRDFLLNLCKNLRLKYEEFQNIIICIYSNNEVGKSLANGSSIKITVQDQKEAWLGLYSYNKVEGEYFDSNPSNYLRPN